MSRIGKQPITIPSGVTLTLDGQTVKVKGSKGELEFTLPASIEPKQEDGSLTLVPADDSKQTRSLWGMARTMVANMIEGTTNGYSKNLELRGVGYRAQMKGSTLNMQLGYSHDVDFDPPEGIKIEAPKPTQLVVSGIDKQQVGQVAAKIRGFRPPEPYKGKGIRYADEYVLSKEGKKK